MSQQTIETYAKEKGIPYLLHFTRAVNLPSIMAHGIYPIGRTHEVGATPVINDNYRFDGHSDSTSLSIGFPNCQMLYKYRMLDATVDWVILVLPPSVLWTKNCAFCCHNAADGRISTQPLANLMTPQAFSGMYQEIEGILSREEQKLKTYDPSDVQAEVLVFDVIEPHDVACVVFEKAAARDAYAPYLGNRKMYLHANNKGMFASRGYSRKYE
ncbi:DarT ssDNA thymidine ADP-ribosyltransferase family protein [Aeromonas salmonicida]|uniref:DarT ssDNA thymidine ADP-ribosyltransferase family protein n=1 Tax=Aeromonas salmonicida TaxID=645 RepID=UPI0007304CDA|nr:DarT ssDNA thymidine ADP-ribosyltransferase family protein [Aeromonas salmonicida]KTA76622.1 hypothetical protein VO68_09570 [Aeromonas salmonicida]